MKRRVLGVLAGLASVFLMGGCAFAVGADNAVYATSDYTSGRLGVASGDATVPVRSRNFASVR